MKISIKDSAIDLGCILLMNTLISLTEKRIIKQQDKAEKVNNHLLVRSCQIQREQIEKIKEFLGDLAKQEWEQLDSKVHNVNL